MAHMYHLAARHVMACALHDLHCTPKQHQQSCHNRDGAQGKFTGGEHINVGARASGAKEGSELTVDDEHESK